MFNKYYQGFQKLIMNSLKLEINESVCQYEKKHCLSGPQFVSSLNVITDSNRFYQPDRTSKLPEEKCNLPKPPQNMQNIPARYPSPLQGAPIPCPGGRLSASSTHKPGSLPSKL